MTIELSPGMLRLAASDARAAASGVAAARQAASAALPDNAFGLMCSWLMLPPYNLVKAVADTLLDEAAESLDRASVALEETATDFATTDAHVAAAMQQLALD